MNLILQKLRSALRKLKNKLTAKTWPSKSIVFYATGGASSWSPLSLKVGTGGSQIAVINLAREWVKLGYDVTVYNNCQGDEGVYEGVNYIAYPKFNEYDKFDTLIIWRYPWRLSPNTKANRIWLELQEVLLTEQVTPAKLARYDQIFVKSQDHRSMLKGVGDSQIAIIPNGVEKRYAQYTSQSKQPYKLIYASNYTRGLESMLTYGWPIIKQEIPEAELHIYYGFPKVNPQSKNDEKDPSSLAWKEKMLKLMSQPGIHEHGRIGVDELIQEKATSTIHYYGCTFRETDCISIRESALVGCIPVTTSYRTLGEKAYCIKVEGSAFEQSTHEALAYKIVELLKNPVELDSIRENCIELAKQETWDVIAQKWLDTANNY